MIRTYIPHVNSKVLEKARCFHGSIFPRKRSIEHGLLQKESLTNFFDLNVAMGSDYMAQREASIITRDTGRGDNTIKHI